MSILPASNSTELFINKFDGYISLYSRLNSLKLKASTPAKRPGPNWGNDHLPCKRIVSGRVKKRS